ncbi:hypothetical protein PIB30_088843 [Stylosanthes scabra]|uniref:CCHC-type domain-containing protein n=1 Tax=Stylosanthes scabra TaxID=79078 RepID=A0ABU6SU77_9FABA|nr:hypothetical protein [Stylosanthes scabra]
MAILESQGGENKKKSLALKASSSHDEESDDEEEDQDFAILMKKFTKFAKGKNLIPNKQNKPPKCYECGEFGHIKPNCPKLQKGEKDKKLKKKQKAFISWENEDDSSTDSDDDEVTNICLMANEEKVSDLNLCEDELQESYDNLLEEFIKISREITATKKLNAELQKENDVLKNENTKLGKIKINPNNNVPCESCLSSTLKLGGLVDISIAIEKSGLMLRFRNP